MERLQRDDFILAKPKKVIDGKVKVSSKYWPSIDTIFVEYSSDVTLSSPFTARIESVERRTVTATPATIPGSDMVSPGEKVKICMNRIVNGIPMASALAMKNLRAISVPDSALGALVSAQIHHIRSMKADAELIEIIESGISIDDSLQAETERGEPTAVTKDDRIIDTRIDLEKPALVSGEASVKLVKIGDQIEGRIEKYDFRPEVNDEYTAEVTRGSTVAKIDWPQKVGIPSIDLEKPALVSGEASVKLTEVGEQIEGKVVEYDFIPRVRERYTTKVIKESTEVEIDWPQKIGVPSVKLDYPAQATMDATVEITDVGNEIHGRIVKYDSIPDVGEELEVDIKRGNVSVRSKKYSIELETEPVASGRAKAVVKKKSLPIVAEITEYAVVSEDDIISAKIPKAPTNIAKPHTGDFDIILENEKTETGYMKIWIERIDETGIYGKEDTKSTSDFSSNDDSLGSSNPITGGSGGDNRNDLISNGKL